MTFFKRVMFLNIFLLLALSVSVLWVSCDNLTNSSTNEDSTGDGTGTGDIDSISQDTLNVDYSGVNNAVFFDFSTGTTTVLPHDFFDIAYNAGGKVIANSGSYGSGVQVYKTDSTDITQDFSSQEANIKEFTFKDDYSKLYDYQTEANPLVDLPLNAWSNVYLIKIQYKTTDTAAYFKVIYGMTMGQSGQSYNMTVVPGLGAGETDKKEIKAAISGITNGYGWLYFKLVGTGGPRVLNNGNTWLETGSTEIPKIMDWDILATRTDEPQSTDGTTVALVGGKPYVAGRSSVLLNIYKTSNGTIPGVQAKVVTEKSIAEITATDLSDEGLSGEIDAIGYGWYTTSGHSVYSVPNNTYVIKTQEGKFAKFQPTTFAKDGKSFVMDFYYDYQE